MIYIFRKEMKKWHSVLWIVFISLALGGVLGYLNYKKTQPSEITIATVNGDSIKLLDFQKALLEVKTQINMYREYARATGISIDMFLSMAGLLNPEEAAYNNCLNNRLLDTQKSYFNIKLDNDYFMKELIAKLPSYLKDSIGNLNINAYKGYLARMNTFPSEFEERMEENFKREFFEKFASMADYITLGQAKENFINNTSKKKFAVLFFPFNKYLDKAKKEKVDFKEIKSFYENNKENYRVSEKRKAMYWLLNSEDYVKAVNVEESTIQSFYDRNKESLFRIPPKVKVRHILFKVKKKDDPEKIETILNKAKEIKKEVENNPDKFKEFAKNLSDDVISSSNGGLLDFFNKGTYDPEFEKAAYRLYKKGEVSDIVKVEDGFELLQLEQRIPASSKPLEKVRSEILKTLRAKKALNNLRADVQRIIYESKTDKDAPLRFVKEKNISGQKTDWLESKDSYGDKLVNILADKVFNSKKKTGEFGVFIKGDDRVLYQVLDVQKSYIPNIETIKDMVQLDLYKNIAKKALKSDIKNAKRVLLSKTKSLKDVASSNNLKIEYTSSLKKTDKVNLFDLDNSFLEKVFLLNSSDQILAYKKDRNYYLVQFKELERTNLVSFSDERDKIVRNLKNKRKGLYLKAFIASLLRTARIEKHEKFIKRAEKN